MRRNKELLLSVVVSVLLVTALACTSNTPASSPTTEPAPDMTPAVEPPPSQSEQTGMVEVLAPIDRVKVEVDESYPPQYFLLVKSGLPNGCTRFENHEVSRQDNVVRVKVTNLVPADANTACTMTYGTVDSRISLGSDFLAGQSYAIDVNGVTTTLKVDSAGQAGSQPGLSTQSGESPPKNLLEELAPVETVRIEVLTDQPSKAELVLVTGLPNTCYQFGEYKNLTHEGGKIRVEVTNLRDIGEAELREVVDADGARHMKIIGDPNSRCLSAKEGIETRIPLGPDIEACKDYLVEVNKIPPHRGFVGFVQAIDPAIECKSDTAEGATTDSGS